MYFRAQEGNLDCREQKKNGLRIKSFLPFRLQQKSNLQGTSEEEIKQLDQEIEVGQRVITTIKDVQTRGTVRYIGEEKDSRGASRKFVGLELVRCNFFFFKSRVDHMKTQEIGGLLLRLYFRK